MTSHVSNKLRNRLIALIDELHDSVWAEAFKAGRDAMREAILRAAQAPDPLRQSLPPLNYHCPRPSVKYTNQASRRAASMNAAASCAG